MINCENCHRYKKSCTGGLAKEQCEKIKLPLTNADRIRAMSDEELAHLLHSAEEHLFTGNLWNYEQWRDWLKSPVEEEK